VQTLNHFLEDIYGRKRILRQRAIPPEVVLSSPQYMREMDGFPVPQGIHCHIAGIDLVRDQRGDFLVLEDNLRTPSGVSYVLVDRDQVFMRTTRGLRRVHVIYRRVDDEWLDPVFGRPDSIVGVPGLVAAYRAGGVVLANGIGNGVADDKAVYSLIPTLIKYYLGEDPILPNVPTYLCALDDQRRHVLAHLEQMVVKTVDGSGGYGMLIGPESSRRQQEAFRRQIEAHPRAFIAQPVVSLSVQPVLDGSRLRPCHQDLRPFVLSGPDVDV